jgi:prevent-host-death family protein
MPTVNIHAAKSQLSRLLDAAVAGEEVIIAKAGKPIARLVPIERKQERRKLGTLAGQFRVPDDFETHCRTKSWTPSKGVDASPVGYPSASLGAQ